MTVKLVRRSSHAHLLVCRSCGDGCQTSSPGSTDDPHRHPSRQLKTALEAELLNGQMPGWQIRVVESSCLDVCPVGAISVRLVDAENSSDTTLTWTMSPDSDVPSLLTEIKKHLRENQRPIHKREKGD